MLHALPMSAAADGVFTLSDRTEARVRDPDPITNAVALDLSTTVDARATLASASTLYTLAYMPSLTLLDVNVPGNQPAFMNNVLASVDWHSHRTRIVVTEKAGYGQLSFESLSALTAPGTPATPVGPTGQPAPLPTQQLVPPTESLLFASSETTVATTLQLRPWTLLTRIGYQLSGGGNGAAQAVLPFQQGPFADATADYRAGTRDHLATVASGSETSFSTGTDALIVGIEEQWRHHWARMTDSMLGAGISEARTRTAADAPYESTPDPVAEAEFDQGFGRGATHGLVRFDVLLAPFVNRLTGLVDERITGILGASLTRRKVTLRLIGTAGESVDEDTVTAGRLLAAELDASYSVSDALSFDAGARTLRQVQNFAGTVVDPTQPTPIVQQTFSQTVVFFAVTVRAVKTKF
jgi:hypothetical protein